MELSADQYADIVRGLGPERGGVSGVEEKRRARRAHRQARVTIVPVDGGENQTPIVVMVKDLSARGMSFVHATRMRRGSQFVIRFARSEGEPIALLCTVAHCRAVSRELFSMGAEFTCRADRVAAANERADQAERERIKRTLMA